MNDFPQDRTIRQVVGDHLGEPPDELATDQLGPAVSFVEKLRPDTSPEDLVTMPLDDEAVAALQAYLDGDPEADPWDEFVAWARRFYEWDGFDADERDYKLEIAENIAAARDAVVAGDEDWHQQLKKAFGAPSNLTYFLNHARYLDWAADSPGEAIRGLGAIWDTNAEVGERIEGFLKVLPEDTLSGAGTRLQIASFLLMIEPTEYVIYRPRPFKSASSLVEYGRFPDEPPVAIYRHALAFLDELIAQAAARGLVLRDRLDAQSLVWAVTQNDPSRIGFDEAAAQKLLRYRGDAPSVWWVNQGTNYEGERDHSYVCAGITTRAGTVVQHHKNVSLMRKGDVVLHYAGRAIRAISSVTHKPQIRPKPDDPQGIDHRVTRTKYHELAEPIPLDDIDLDLRVAEGGPFDRNGRVKQIYMFPTSVGFSDWLHERFQPRWPEDSPWASRQRTTWLFQANPDVWDFEANLDRMEIGDDEDWSVSRYKAEIALGDRVVLWQAGARSGIYALGEITGELFKRASDEEHFTEAEEETAIPWRLTKKIDPPILRADLLDHPVLGGLQVISAPQGSNFRVSDEQWVEIRRLIDGNGRTAEAVQARNLDEVASFVADQGLSISGRMLRRFHASLRTRGFVILSGISGTGKTWLTEVYAEAVGAEYLLVPVAPNWMTNEDLLGYENPLDNVYHHTVFSSFLIEAASEWEEATREQREPRQYVLTLDEMNLARVEYYFAKFLSAMEVRSRKGTAQLELAPNEQVRLTPNLLFIGTVNVDETTHGFADKVYDRAQLIELEAPRDAIAAHIGNAAYRSELLDIYDAVAESKPFAFRIVDEVKAYVGESETLGVTSSEALDEQILQKVLTKLNGSDPNIRSTLDRLVNVAEEHGFELTRTKARRMLHDYDQHGFTSYF